MGKTSRVYVYGLRGVGKTAILEQSIYGKYTKDTFLQSTIEDIYPALVETDRGTRERMRFYDTAGGVVGEATGSRDILQRPVVSPADGYLLVYDTNKMESLDWIVEVKKEIDRNREKKEVVVVVVGNKKTLALSSTNNQGSIKDLGQDSSVGVKANTWANRERLRLFQVSALKRESLYEPLTHLASRLNPAQAKTGFAAGLRAAKKSTSSVIIGSAGGGGD